MSHPDHSWGKALINFFASLRLTINLHFNKNTHSGITVVGYGNKNLAAFSKTFLGMFAA